MVVGFGSGQSFTVKQKKVCHQNLYKPTMSESLVDFLNYKISYGFGIIVALLLYRYMDKQVFPTQKFQHSERLFWANLLLFCQMLNVGFVFVGFLMMSQESKIVPDLIFETGFLVLIGFVTFGGIDGEINFFNLCKVETHPSVIGFGFYFHAIWNTLHIFQFIPSYTPLFYSRASVLFDLYIGYKLFVKSYTVDSTNNDYQNVN